MCDCHAIRLFLVNALVLEVVAAATAQEPLKVFKVNREVSDVSFSPDSKQVAAALLSHSVRDQFARVTLVRIWDVSTGKETINLGEVYGQGCTVSWSRDGKLLACAGSSKLFAESDPDEVRIWDASGKVLHALKGHKRALTSVSFSPDGKRLAGSGGELLRRGEILVWDTESAKVLLTIKQESTDFFRDVMIRATCWSPDGKHLASASDDKTVRIWDAESGKELRVLKGHTARVASVSFSPDGKRLASASDDKSVRIWDAESGKEIFSLKGHVDAVGRVIWSPNSKRLASASQDKTVRLWDAETGKEAGTLKGHQGAVTSVSFSPDGKLLASGSQEGQQGDGAVRIWDAAPAP